MSQRTGTKLLTATEQQTVQRLLDLPEIDPRPTAREPWDGPDSIDARMALGRELTAALTAAVEKDFAKVAWKEKAGTVPMTELKSPALAARLVVLRTFREWTDLAALTRRRFELREKFCSSQERPSLIDVADAAGRAKVGHKVDPRGMALHLAATDEGCRMARAAHHFISNRSNAESWFYDGFIASFTAFHESMLSKCDRFGYEMTDPKTGKMFLSGAVKDWTADMGEASPLVRDFKWSKFKLLVHEYLHFIEHPLLPEATAKSQTVKEGFCEYLTCKVLRSLPDWPPEDLSSLTEMIEGVPNPKRSYEELRNYQPSSQYKEYVDSVEKAVGIIGDNGLMAAFFQGHVEFLGRIKGLEWGWAPPVESQGLLRSMFMPTGVTTLDSLAGVTGRMPDEIIAANADKAEALRGGAPWPTQIRLPGFHGHLVVLVRDDDEDDAYDDDTGSEDAGSEDEEASWETREQIARQNGVAAKDLQKANPGPPEHDPTTWLLVPDSTTT